MQLLAPIPLRKKNQLKIKLMCHIFCVPRPANFPTMHSRKVCKYQKIKFLPRGHLRPFLTQNFKFWDQCHFNFCYVGNLFFYRFVCLRTFKNGSNGTFKKIDERRGHTTHNKRTSQLIDWIGLGAPRRIQWKLGNTFRT